MFEDANKMGPENGEGSSSQQRLKGKAKKLDKPHNARKRKGSRASIQGESNSNGRFEDEDDSDDDVDDDEDEREGDEDETGRNQGGAARASGSSKRKRLLSSTSPGKGKGKVKDGLEPEGKKRKKLRSVENTKKHACSRCGKRFSRPSQRDTHYLTHTGQVK
jgi:hypothetical protein